MFILYKMEYMITKNKKVLGLLTTIYS